LRKQKKEGFKVWFSGAKMSKKRFSTYATLAYEILKKAGGAMHYVDITKEIVKVKKTRGKTPQHTLRNRIALDSRFVRVGKGIYDLKERR